MTYGTPSRHLWTLCQFKKKVFFIVQSKGQQKEVRAHIWRLIFLPGGTIRGGEKTATWKQHRTWHGVHRDSMKGKTTHTQWFRGGTWKFIFLDYPLSHMALPIADRTHHMYMSFSSTSTDATRAIKDWTNKDYGLENVESIWIQDFASCTIRYISHWAEARPRKILLLPFQRDWYQVRFWLINALGLDEIRECINQISKGKGSLLGLKLDLVEIWTCASDVGRGIVWQMVKLYFERAQAVTRYDGCAANASLSL